MKRAGTRALAAAFVATSALGSSAFTGATPAHALVVYPCHWSVDPPGLVNGWITGSGQGTCDGDPDPIPLHVEIDARPHGWTSWPMVIDQISSNAPTPEAIALSARCLHGTNDYRTVMTFGSWSSTSSIKTFSCK